MRDHCWRQFLLLCTVLLAAPGSLLPPARAESSTAVLQLKRDVCYPLSSASSRFLGQATRLACIVECAKTNLDFDAVQMLPSMQAGTLDCECISLKSGSPGGRFNCERWDFQVRSSSSGGGGGGSSSPGGTSNIFSATFCPSIPSAWSPVIDINKCILMKNDVALTMASLTGGSPCTSGYQLFNLTDLDTENQLIKYMTYLSGRGLSAPYWVSDSRSGTATPCAVVVANGTVIMAPGGSCETSSSSQPYMLYPICKTTLSFPGAYPSQLLLIVHGGTNLLWYHFNTTQVQRNESCPTSSLLRIDSNDMFMRLKEGIVSRQNGSNPSQVWIASSTPGSYVASQTSIISECITLNVTSVTDSLSATIAAEDCSVPHYHICQAEVGNDGTGTSGQSTWLVSNVCPLLTQPPTDAQQVRTVGHLCYFYTSSQHSMSTMSNDACSPGSPGPFIPAQINGDYIRSRNYVTRIPLTIVWQAWMFSGGWNGEYIDGYAITPMVSGNGSYYLNSSGDPFRGYSGTNKYVICRSSQEVCNSSLNYWNFASATNSCVAVEIATVNLNQSIASCEAKSGGGGALLKLDNEEKFNQTRELVILTNNKDKLFWVDNGTSTGCKSLQVTSQNASWMESVNDRPCNDMQNFMCEKTYIHVHVV